MVSLPLTLVLDFVRVRRSLAAYRSPQNLSKWPERMEQRAHRVDQCLWQALDHVLEFLSDEVMDDEMSDDQLAEKVSSSLRE